MTDKEPPQSKIVWTSGKTLLGRLFTTVSSTATHPFETTTVVSGTPEAARSLSYVAPTWTVKPPPTLLSGDTVEQAVEAEPLGPLADREDEVEPEAEPEPEPEPLEPMALIGQAPPDASPGISLTARVIPWEYKVAVWIVGIVTLAAFGLFGVLSLQDTLTEHARIGLEFSMEIGKLGLAVFLGLLTGKSA